MVACVRYDGTVKCVWALPLFGTPRRFPGLGSAGPDQLLGSRWPSGLPERPPLVSARGLRGIPEHFSHRLPIGAGRYLYAVFTVSLRYPAAHPPYIRLQRDSVNKKVALS